MDRLGQLDALAVLHPGGVVGFQRCEKYQPPIANPSRRGDAPHSGAHGLGRFAQSLHLETDGVWLFGNCGCAGVRRYHLRFVIACAPDDTSAYPACPPLGAIWLMAIQFGRVPRSHGVKPNPLRLAGRCYGFSSGFAGPLPGLAARLCAQVFKGNGYAGAGGTRRRAVHREKLRPHTQPYACRAGSGRQPCQRRGQNPANHQHRRPLWALAHRFAPMGGKAILGLGAGNHQVSLGTGHHRPTIGLTCPFAQSLSGDTGALRCAGRLAVCLPDSAAAARRQTSLFEWPYTLGLCLLSIRGLGLHRRVHGV